MSEEMNERGGVRSGGAARSRAGWLVPSPRLLGSAFLAAASFLAVLTGPARAEEGELLAFLPFAVPSPQDLAFDEDDGTFWVTTFLQSNVYRYSADLTVVLDAFEAPFGSNRYLTGLAYNSNDKTLLVVDSISGDILEMAKDGQPTGRVITPQFQPLVGNIRRPTPLGLAFHANGDNGRGSIYVVESVGTAIYELTLDGVALRWFAHPDDPDGFPGEGATAPSNHDVDLIIEDGEVVGFWVTGGPYTVKGAGRSSIRKLGPDGSYGGVSVSLDDAGGNVSGLLRRPFQLPGSDTPVDAFICVVDSSARFAILEGGEPTFREVLDFQCEITGEAMRLTWSSPQEYSTVEIVEGCDVLATLPGTATEWTHTFDEDGVHEIRLRASEGEMISSPPPCTIVVGGGEVLSAAEVTTDLDDTMIPLDLTSDGKEILLVSTNVVAEGRLFGKILLFDYDFNSLGVIDLNESFAGPEDYISGVAYAPSAKDEFFYVLNASTSKIGKFDSVGALVTVVDAGLPNLEEDPEKDPDYGLVIGMTFDPEGDEGEGSLWVVEIARDWIYELDLSGAVIRDFPHPYLAVEPPPPDSPYGIQSSGVTLNPWGAGVELFLGGGALRENAQRRLFQVNKDTGKEIPGTDVPTRGIQDYGSTYSFGIEAIEKDGEPRMIVLTRNGSEVWLLELRLEVSPVAAPTFVTARQETRRNEVIVEFQNNGPYDQVEVFRDCTNIAAIQGDATRFVDRDAPPGLHDYAVRGIAEGIESPRASTSVRVGLGAVLERTIIWPVRSPQQVTRDPEDGTFIVVGNYPGEERSIYVFDPEFRHLETREAAIDPPWKIATLSMRHPLGQEGEIDYITWEQPVPLGGVASQKFLLVRENLVGDLLASVEIFPPRPSNGFITYPTGLTWNERTDSFFYLERNSHAVVEMSPEGAKIREFPHPFPPFQNFVFGLGLAAAPGGESLFFTTAGRRDQQITKILEMDLDGQLTGLEIPIDGVAARVTGIAFDELDLITAASTSFPEAIRLKVFDDTDPSFIRGDADANTQVNLTDAVMTLLYLFQGGESPPCLDAADSDDSGMVSLTDAIVTLNMLFLGAGPLPPPFPDSGIDPTDDDLECF